MTDAIRFRIYYADGTTYDGPVDHVPIWEVLVIVERDPMHGRKLVSSGDYYIYDNARWIACDLMTVWQYLARPGMLKRVLVGVMVDSERWQETMRRARYDPDFPAQTALHHYESREAFEKVR